MTVFLCCNTPLWMKILKYHSTVQRWTLSRSNSNKVGWQAYTTFSSCQNAARSNKVFFLCWVDNDLEGCTFSLSNCDFSRLFHTERSWHTSIYCGFVSGLKDFPSNARAFSVTSAFEASSILLRLNKGSKFLQSAFWIWITKRFLLVRECK